MLRHLSKNKAFASITEIVITAIIFVISSVAVLSAISAVRPKGGAAIAKLEAAYLAKAKVEELRARVDARTWNVEDGDLMPGFAYEDTSDPNYVVSWQVDDVSNIVGAPAGTLRKVTMNVTY